MFSKYHTESKFNESTSLHSGAQRRTTVKRDFTQQESHFHNVRLLITAKSQDNHKQLKWTDTELEGTLVVD